MKCLDFFKTHGHDIQFKTITHGKNQDFLDTEKILWSILEPILHMTVLNYWKNDFIYG